MTHRNSATLIGGTVVCLLLAFVGWLVTPSPSSAPTVHEQQTAPSRTRLSKRIPVSRPTAKATTTDGDPSCEGQAEAAQEELLLRCAAEIDAAFCYGERGSLVVATDAFSCANAEWPTTCDNLIEHMVCDEALSVSLDAHAMHQEDVEYALDELRTRCARFRDVRYFLDCDRLPCVLGIPRDQVVDQDVGVHDLMCFDDLIVDSSPMTQYNSATLVPMYTVSSESVPTDLRARWTRTRSLRWKELSTFPGFFEMEDGPDVGQAEP